MTDAELPRARRAARLRRPAIRGAQLLAAWGFALAQPLFDLLGKNAEFFVARGSTPSDIVLFALVVTFAPPLVLLAVELMVGRFLSAGWQVPEGMESPVRGRRGSIEFLLHAKRAGAAM